MTSHELARKLLEMPDVMVTRNGYEGGVDEITTVSEPRLLALNVNESRYYGKHDYQADIYMPQGDGECMAIHIS
jgi:hypothetical protein